MEKRHARCSSSAPIRLTLSGGPEAQSPFSTAERFAEVALMVDQNKISVGAAGPIFDSLAESDASPESIATELGLMQVSDTAAIDAAIEKLIAENPKPLQDFKAGKQAAMGSLVGMVMKSAKGLNPKMVQEALKRRLS